MASNKEYYGITLQSEKDYSAIATDLKLWDEHIPLKAGDTFPSEEMKKRADINKTMDMLVSNELAEVLGKYLCDMPDLNPFQAQRIMDIVSSLPIFDTLVSGWTSILTPCFKGVKVNGVERKDIWQEAYPQVEAIIKNIFTACDRATLVYKAADRVKIRVFTDKNIVLFRTLSDERVVTITNVIKDKKGQKLECLSYLPDGRCIRDVFKYSNERIGQQLVADEIVQENRTIVYAKNGKNNKDYGYPELVGSISSSLGVIRAFSALARLIEQSREEIKVLPSSAVRKDPVTGAAAYISNGTVGYDELNKDAQHDAAILKPELDFDGVIKALEAMLKQVSIYSGLSGIILGFEQISGNASGRLLLASCVPTMLRANRYISVLSNELTNLIVEVAKYSDETINAEDVELIVATPDNALLNIVNGADEETWRGKAASQSSALDEE